MAQNEGLNADKAGEIDINPGMALEKVDSWVDGLVKLFPNLVIAVIVFALFFVLAKIVRSIIFKTFKGNDRSNLGEVLGGFVKWVVLILGALIAATIIVPSLNPADLIAGLGVSSVAIGFAFKDILQNWLAGLLILLRQPFEIGDQIEASGFEGTVQKIETRATIVRTYDGQRAVIPNSEIYTNAVLVKTGEGQRRSQYDIGIGYADDIDEACEIIAKAISSIDGVTSDPAPETFVWDLAASWVTIRARWWTNSPRGDVVVNRSQILRAVKYALDEAGIDMPYDTKVQLFHDQTEDVDGDRDAQREGWPAPKQGDKPKPRYKVLQNSKTTTKRRGSKANS